jgi:hypothetical protein
MGVKKRLDCAALGHSYGNVARRVMCPLILGSQEPLNFTHESYSKFGLEGSFKPGLDSVASRKISKIIHVNSNINGWLARNGRTSKYRRSMRAGSEPQVCKDCFDEFIPMSGAAAKTV